MLQRDLSRLLDIMILGHNPHKMTSFLSREEGNAVDPLMVHELSATYHHQGRRGDHIALL